MCSDTMTTEEVRAAVAAALKSDDFPGYFLHCQVGIGGVAHVVARERVSVTA